MTSAVVFAYHNVGVRCLAVLLAQGVDVPFVVTHRDSPREHIWFASVAELARQHDIRVLTPGNPNERELAREVATARPDFLFSFYYRRMLALPLLEAAGRGAFNMHGSLLPKYRGRAPVNWAIIHGETETGATLHAMAEKPDAGDIVDRMAVPILPDDTALEVFNKVTVAAEIVLHRSLPRLIDGSARLVPQDPAQASYFGGRSPQDGRIDWRKSAREIHNLVRAVAPPYPGAFTALWNNPARILKTAVASDEAACGPRAELYAQGGRCYVRCAGGGVLRLIGVEIDGAPAAEPDLAARIGGAAVGLE